MKLWEYYVVDLKIDSDASENESTLNGYGADGWELVTVIPDPTDGTYLRHFFKRPKA